MPSNAAFLRPRLALPMAAGLLAAMQLAACSRTVCQNEIIQASPAPDGAAIAFVFDHTCSPQGGVSTQVSLIALHDALRDGTGNILALSDKQPVKIAWRGPKQLIVTGFQNPAFQIDKPLGSVTVEFP